MLRGPVLVVGPVEGCTIVGNVFEDVKGWRKNHRAARLPKHLTPHHVFIIFTYTNISWDFVQGKYILLAWWFLWRAGRQRWRPEVVNSRQCRAGSDWGSSLWRQARIESSFVSLLLSFLLILEGSILISEQRKITVGWDGEGRRDMHLERNGTSILN